MRADRVDLVELVRSVQRRDGHMECFCSGRIACDEYGCQWREYCLDRKTGAGETDIPSGGLEKDE